ncbi:DUF2127 domain-containing protein [Bacteroidota bacterium]
MEKPFSIVLACIFLVLSGLMGIIMGAIILTQGPSMADFLQQGEMRLQEQLAFWGTYSGGIIPLIWGLLDIIAAYGLWRLKRWAAYLAIGLSLLMIIVAVRFWDLLSIVDITFGLLVLILVTSGLKKLTPHQIPAEEIPGEIPAGDSQ